MQEAYGKEAVEILEKRPGLNLFNIANTEVFNKNITKNFSKDFVDDCLSYNFTNYNNWVADMQNPEETKAFKFYFEIESKKLGENVTTMERCISRYSNFKELLIDASQKENLTPSEQRRIEIKSTMVGRGYSNSDKITYQLDSLEMMKKANLTQNEMNSLRFWNENNFQDKKINTMLESAKIEDTLGVFQNEFSGINKMKQKQMEYLNNQFTNMEKINEAIKNNEYGVKKKEIDGFTYIDLGKMPVSFAVHDPGGNNANLTGIGQEMGRLSKEGLESFLDYEEEDGVSTISARPINNMQNFNGVNGESYIWWGIPENEVIKISETDGQIDHSPKLPNAGTKYLQESGKRADISIKDYKTITKEGSGAGEIAFYRRKREHRNLENEKYGRKIIPNAVIGLSEYDVLKRFDEPVTIILPRGTLEKMSEQDFTQDRLKHIKEAKQKIKDEEKEYQNITNEEMEL